MMNRALSIDTETTGIHEGVQLIEFSCVPFCIETREIRSDLIFHTLIKCDSYESLKPTLSDWVKEHNKDLIIKAHEEGVEHHVFKSMLHEYLSSDLMVSYLGDAHSIIGKSMNSLDLPLLERYLGWDFMRKHFVRRTEDIADISRFLVKRGELPNGVTSSKKLMEHFEMGSDVEHRAINDCIDMINIYFKLLDL